MIEKAGFDHVEVGSRTDVLAGAKGEAAASQFGTRGITIKAVKPLGGQTSN